MLNFRYVAGSEFVSKCNKSNVSRKAKQLYHGFLEQFLLLPNGDFTCSKLTIETLKTLKQDVKFIWS